VNHRSDAISPFTQDLVERFSLGAISRVPIEERSSERLRTLTLELIEPLQKDAQRQLVRNERSTIVVTSHLPGKFVIAGHQLAEEVARSNVHKTQPRSDAGSLRTFPRSLRTDQHHVTPVSHQQPPTG